VRRGKNAQVFAARHIVWEQPQMRGAITMPGELDQPRRKRPAGIFKPERKKGVWKIEKGLRIST
jgi:hypothetical protein